MLNINQPLYVYMRIYFRFCIKAYRFKRTFQTVLKIFSMSCINKNSIMLCVRYVCVCAVCVHVWITAQRDSKLCLNLYANDKLIK